MSKKNNKDAKRKKKVQEHKEFLHSLSNKYEKPYIQRQRLLPGSIYLDRVLNGEPKDD